MSPPPPSPSITSWTRFEPVASTSRIPYSAHTPPATTTTTMSTRAFSTSSPSRSSRSRAYLIHPMARQRLTNLTFLSAGLLSVLTVSLAMSGTFGEGAAPGCPARVRTGVALEEQERRSAAAAAADDGDGDGDGGDGDGSTGGRRMRRKWWESSKAKGRFLEDPVVVPSPAQSPNALSTVATPHNETAPGLSERSRDSNTAQAQTPHAAEGQVVGGVAAGYGRSADWRSGWKGLRDPEERVV